jgi:hypothetical protein
VTRSRSVATILPASTRWKPPSPAPAEQRRGAQEKALHELLAVRGAVRILHVPQVRPVRGAALVEAAWSLKEDDSSQR